MEQCLKCGGTGIDLNNQPCTCGIKPKKVQELSPIEIYVPDLYRNQSDYVGTEEILVGDLKEMTLQGYLNEWVDDLKSLPSMFLDLSTSRVGAYEVYYAIIEKVILKYGDLPEPIRNRFWVNELNAPYMKASEKSVREGIPKYINIISDFKIERYEGIEDYVKVFKPKLLTDLNPYPLNMYHVVVKSRGGF